MQMQQNAETSCATRSLSPVRLATNHKPLFAAVGGARCCTARHTADAHSWLNALAETALGASSRVPPNSRDEIELTWDCALTTGARESRSKHRCAQAA
jgi:hypothetical protein